MCAPLKGRKRQQGGGAQTGTEKQRKRDRDAHRGTELDKNIEREKERETSRIHACKKYTHSLVKDPFTKHIAWDKQKCVQEKRFAEIILHPFIIACDFFLILSLRRTKF